MALLDVTIVNVALPSIQRGLHASAAQIQWVLSGYALTFGLLLVPGGRLGDIRGRRRMFLVGLVAFTLTSAAAGLARRRPAWLVIARLLQGAAAGLLTPQITGLIQQLFTGAERGRAFGVFGTTVGISAAIGPILGGLILAAFGQDDGWRYVFFVNVPIGVVAVVLAMRLLPRAGPRQGSVRSQIDGVGALLLGVGVVAAAAAARESSSWQAAARGCCWRWPFRCWSASSPGRRATRGPATPHGRPGPVRPPVVPLGTSWASSISPGSPRSSSS